MALVGAMLGSKGSHSQTWYGLFKDSYIAILIGAGVELILGYAFARHLPKVSE
jgi:hypothetical protein